MTKKQITLEEALKLVDFQQAPDGYWGVKDVLVNVWGNVEGDVGGTVGGTIGGTINNRKWVFIETREEVFRRLLEETGDTQLIDAFNQLKDNS